MVLVLWSVTGGKRTAEVPADKINLEFVLGNKVIVGMVNANHEYFEMGPATWPMPRPRKGTRA